MDILNKLDPMPCGFGPAIKAAAKPTAAELREKELREFETKTDACQWRVSVKGIDWFTLRPMTDSELQASFDVAKGDAMLGFRQTTFVIHLDPNRQESLCRQGFGHFSY